MTFNPLGGLRRPLLNLPEVVSETQFVELCVVLERGERPLARSAPPGSLGSDGTGDISLRLHDRDIF